MSCSEPEPDTCRMSHSPPLSDFSYGSEAGYVQLPLPDCNMGRPLVYLGSFLGLLCAVGGVATATFVLAGGPHADELMRHSNEFAKFRTTPTPTSPASEARQARKKGAATGPLPPIWRDRPATTALTSGTAGHVMTPPPRTPFSASQGAESSGSNTKAVGSERPLTTSSDTKASSATTETQNGGKVKSIESGGVGTDVNPDVTASNHPRGLLAALPLPTKVHGPGPRSLLCLVEGGGVRPGPPLHECSHLILGDQVFDFLQRVIRPPRRVTHETSIKLERFGAGPVYFPPASFASFATLQIPTLSRSASNCRFC
ncbi:uncharacterized protein LOC142591310 [Dermacentor variabilis]|uniref:uncharacterized protein LOC142591310 n=1 Tax=Dermacentor variabilis TaxID=34621 RepID=UPI003F5C3CFC